MFENASQVEIFDCDLKFNDYVTNTSIQNYDFLIDINYSRLIIEKFFKSLKESDRIWDLKRLYDLDFSSVSPIFRPKFFSTLFDEFKTVKAEKSKENIELEFDFDIKFPPKKRSIVNINIVNIRKGEPNVYLDDFKYIDETEKDE